MELEMKDFLMNWMYEEKIGVMPDAYFFFFFEQWNGQGALTEMERRGGAWR